MKCRIRAGVLCVLVVVFWAMVAAAADAVKKDVDVGKLKPMDSELKVKVGEQAPDFTLKSITGKSVTLSEFREKNNVVISFIPAAWAAICSDQWPGYNIAKDIFQKNDAVLLGISVDNIPALHAWVTQMDGLWFPVLSDFWPHGAVASKYGVLRSDGIAERAVFIVDKKGKIRFIGLQDINTRPPLEEIVKELEKIK
ncbi:MAG TPA: peroxiredoxin [Deltaproteobacteria bacterium]|nr:peroxiredoxin [Deltaproteobacteria bacterium]